MMTLEGGKGGAGYPRVMAAKGEAVTQGGQRPGWVQQPLG
jgi:hypothetical protein